MARADRIMSVFVPVIATVVTTAMSTVITVAHTPSRRALDGRRRKGPDGCRIFGPLRRWLCTMGMVSAKPSAISAAEHRRHRDEGQEHPLADDDRRATPRTP